MANRASDALARDPHFRISLAGDRRRQCAPNHMQHFGWAQSFSTRSKHGHVPERNLVAIDFDKREAIDGTRRRIEAESPELPVSELRNYRIIGVVYQYRCVPGEHIVGADVREGLNRWLATHCVCIIRGDDMTKFWSLGVSPAMRLILSGSEFAISIGRALERIEEHLIISA